MMDNLSAKKKPPPPNRPWKLVVDPVLRKGLPKVVRYDGVVVEKPALNAAQPQDPRTQRCVARSVSIDLMSTSFKVDDNYVGEPPAIEVTFNDLNDNVNQTFLTELCQKFGEVVEAVVMHHPITKRHLGVGRAVFRKPAAARECIKKYNEARIMGTVASVYLDKQGKMAKTIYDEKVSGVATSSGPRIAPGNRKNVTLVGSSAKSLPSSAPSVSCVASSFAAQVSKVPVKVEVEEDLIPGPQYEPLENDSSTTCSDKRIAFNESLLKFQREILKMSPDPADCPEPEAPSYEPLEPVVKPCSHSLSVGSSSGLSSSTNLGDSAFPSAVASGSVRQVPVWPSRLGVVSGSSQLANQAPMSAAYANRSFESTTLAARQSLPSEAGWPHMHAAAAYPSATLAAARGLASNFGRQQASSLSVSNQQQASNAAFGQDEAWSNNRQRDFRRNDNNVSNWQPNWQPSSNEPERERYNNNNSGGSNRHNGRGRNRSNDNRQQEEPHNFGKKARRAAYGDMRANIEELMSQGNQRFQSQECESEIDLQSAASSSNANTGTASSRGDYASPRKARKADQDASFARADDRPPWARDESGAEERLRRNESRGSVRDDQQGQNYVERSYEKETYRRTKVVSGLSSEKVGGSAKSSGGQVIEEYERIVERKINNGPKLLATEHRSRRRRYDETGRSSVRKSRSLSRSSVDTFEELLSRKRSRSRGDRSDSRGRSRLSRSGNKKSSFRRDRRSRSSSVDRKGQRRPRRSPSVRRSAQSSKDRSERDLLRNRSSKAARRSRSRSRSRSRVSRQCDRRRSVSRASAARRKSPSPPSLRQVAPAEHSLTVEAVAHIPLPDDTSIASACSVEDAAEVGQKASASVSDQLTVWNQSKTASVSSLMMSPSDVLPKTPNSLDTPTAQQVKFEVCSPSLSQFSGKDFGVGVMGSDGSNSCTTGTPDSNVETNTKSVSSSAGKTLEERIQELLNVSVTLSQPEEKRPSSVGGSNVPKAASFPAENICRGDLAKAASVASFVKQEDNVPKPPAIEERSIAPPVQCQPSLTAVLATSGCVPLPPTVVPFPFSIPPPSVMPMGFYCPPLPPGCDVGFPRFPLLHDPSSSCYPVPVPPPPGNASKSAWNNGDAGFGSFSQQKQFFHHPNNHGSFRQPRTYDDYNNGRGFENAHLHWQRNDHTNVAVYNAQQPWRPPMCHHSPDEIYVNEVAADVVSGVTKELKDALWRDIEKKLLSVALAEVDQWIHEQDRAKQPPYHPPQNQFEATSSKPAQSAASYVSPPKQGTESVSAVLNRLFADKNQCTKLGLISSLPKMPSFKRKAPPPPVKDELDSDYVSDYARFPHDLVDERSEAVVESAEEATDNRRSPQEMEDAAAECMEADESDRQKSSICSSASSAASPSSSEASSDSDENDSEQPSDDEQTQGEEVATEEESQPEEDYDSATVVDESEAPNATVSEQESEDDQLVRAISPAALSEMTYKVDEVEQEDGVAAEAHFPAGDVCSEESSAESEDEDESETSENETAESEEASSSAEEERSGSDSDGEEESSAEDEEVSTVEEAEEDISVASAKISVSTENEHAIVKHEDAISVEENLPEHDDDDDVLNEAKPDVSFVVDSVIREAALPQKPDGAMIIEDGDVYDPLLYDHFFYGSLCPLFAEAPTPIDTNAIFAAVLGESGNFVVPPELRPLEATSPKKRGRKKQPRLSEENKEEFRNLFDAMAVFKPPPQKEKPKRIFPPRRSDEEMKLLVEYREKGLDREDCEFLRFAYESLEYEDGYAWLKFASWVDPPQPVQQKPQQQHQHLHYAFANYGNLFSTDELPISERKSKKKSRARSASSLSPDSTPKHKSGSARTEGFYQLSSKEKKLHFTRRVHTDQEKEHLFKAKQQASLTREARSMQRKILTVFGEPVDSLTFNQLKLRKKLIKFGRSPIHNWGLFALEDIVPDQMIVEYVGQKIRLSVAERREKNYEKMGIGSSYLFRMDGDHVIDATKFGNLARFINHSCSPNCYAKIISMTGEKKIVIYSKDLIKANEEITYDYKFPIEEEKIPCNCGSINCKGTLN